MLNAVFTSPYSYYVDPTLDPKSNPVTQTARVQEARRSSHKEKTITNQQHTNTQPDHKHTVKRDDKEYDPIDSSPSPPPSLMTRRASLDYHLGSEIPSLAAANYGTSPTRTPSHQQRKLSKEMIDKIDMPYTINGEQHSDEENLSVDDLLAPPALLRGSSLLPSYSNGLARIDLGVITSSNLKELSHLCRSGFSSSQRKDVWPRLLVLPSSVVHVDVSAYYQTVEKVWHIPRGSITNILQDDEDTDALSDVKSNELHKKLPTEFPSAPTLGRREPFDWNWTLNPDSSDVLAQKRILCALCAVHSLTFAPQLPSVVCTVYRALMGDEARTFSFVSAMIERSMRDEHFLLLSPVSVEVFTLGFRKAFNKYFTSLADHFDRIEFDAGDWFREQVLNGFLSSNLPTEAILRVWDAAIVAGTHAAYIKFGLSIFARFEPYLLSGSPSKDEVSSKLSKLLAVINLSSFFRSTLRDGLGWSAKDGWWSRSELAKWTIPTKDTNIAIGTQMRELEARRYRVPIFLESKSGADSIMDLKMCYQLYGGLLPPSTSLADPFCSYSTAREGHSLKSLMQSIWDDESDTAVGTLILVRTFQRKVFGVFFNRFPRRPQVDAAGGDSRTLRSVSMDGCHGFVVNFKSGSNELNVKPFKGSNAGKKVDSLDTDESTTVSDEFTGGSSLPTLPVEGGPGSTKSDGKRRGSFALILDAFHLKKGDDELNPANSDSSNRLIAGVAPLSPFKHPSLRIIDPEDESDVAGVQTDPARTTSQPPRHFFQRTRSTPLIVSSPPASAKSNSAPSSPHLSALNASLDASSSPSQSTSSSLASTPSRRKSIVAGLERVWSFIDSVPTTQHQGPSVSPSMNPSPVISRKSSLTGSVQTGFNSRANSPLPSGAKQHSFFPSAPTTPNARHRIMNVKNRTSPAGISLPPRGPTTDTAAQTLPNALLQQVIQHSMRARSQTTDRAPVVGPNGSTLERHLSTQRVREAGWDSIAATSTSDHKDDVPSLGRRFSNPNIASHPMSPPFENAAIGSATHHYRMSITSPPHSQASPHATGSSARALLLRQSSSPNLSRRGSNSLIQPNEIDSIRTLTPIEPDLITGTPSPETYEIKRRGSVSPSLHLSPHLRPLTPVDVFLSTSAAFRAGKDPFKLNVDDTSHSQMVHMAVDQDQRQQPATDSKRSTASVLLSDFNFILHDPESQLLFSLNQTLEEGVIQCTGMSISDEPNGHIDCSTVEAWSFQATEST